MRLLSLFRILSTSVVFCLSVYSMSAVSENSNYSLGVSGGYNAFVYGDFTAQYTDIQGKLFAGGDIVLNGYGAASTIDTSADTYTLISGGDIHYNNGKLYTGSMLVAGDASNVTASVRSGMEAGAQVIDGAVLPFSYSQIFQDLQQTSLALSQAQATGTVEYKWGGAYLTGDCASDVQIFHLDGATVFNSNTFSVNCVPSHATLIFNIDGASPGFKNVGLSHLQAYATKSIYNFYEASNVNFVNVGVKGSVLAPFADILNPRGHIDGTVIAKSWNGPMELHHFPFTGDLSFVIDEQTENSAPEIISTPILLGLENTHYAYLVEAIDADADSLTYTLDVSPLGMTIDEVSGEISWLPNENQIGDHSVNVIVFDSEGGQVSQLFTLTIEKINEVPIVTSYPEVEVQVENTYAYTVVAEDSDQDVLTYALIQAPDNMLISDDGLISWVPTLEQIGANEIIISVSDGIAEAVTQSFTIDVLPKPNAIPVAENTFVSVLEDTAIAITLVAQDADNDALNYTLVSSVANGVLTGTAPSFTYTPNPNFSGSDTLVFNVNDGKAQSENAAVNISIVPVNDTPTASAQTISLDEDSTIPFTLAANDIDSSNLDFRIVTSLENGVLSGYAPNLIYTPSPNYFGEDSFTYVVQDEELESEETTVSFVVSSVNDLPVVTSVSPENVTEGEVYYYPVEVSDVDSTIFSYALINAPEGMSIDSSTGEITWSPQVDQSGQFGFQIKVDDFAGGIATQSVLISVSANEAPEFISAPLTSSKEGVTYSYVPEVIDPNNNALNFSSLVAPEGMSIDSSTGELTWLPKQEYAQSINQINTSCLSPVVEKDNFDAVLKWKWTTSDIEPNFNQVMMTPLVAQTNDDNADGVIDIFDTPDVIFTTYSSGYGQSSSTAPAIIRVVSGEDGSELIVIDQVKDIRPFANIAVGDIDNDGEIEIIAPGFSGVYAFELDGTQKWLNPVAASAVSLTDLEGDGKVEIIASGQVLSADGELLWTSGTGGIATVADIDLDGVQEVIFGGTVYDVLGNLVWQAENVTSGYNGVGNFDNDDFPEVIVVNSGSVYLLDHDGTELWRVGIYGNGGPPVIADIDGDGDLEVGVAGNLSYRVFNADGILLWSAAIDDRSSSATGSSVFDFNNDGAVEVVYADQEALYIFDGTTGQVRFQTDHGSGTANEYPIIVDIDNDDHAEIVISQNQFLLGNYNGIRVFEGVNDDWSATRSIWNQHAYNINNVNDDGSIPAVMENSWLTHNTFRLNTFADRPARGMVDLRVGDISFGPSGNTVSATIQNIGLAPLTREVEVAFYYGNPNNGGERFGVVTLDRLINQSEKVLSVEIGERDLLQDIYVAVNEDQLEEECQHSNNTGQAAYVMIQVEDREPLFDTQEFLINVQSENVQPEITSLFPDTLILVGVPFDYQVSASDANIGDAYAFSLVDAPDGMTINPDTGFLEWIPSSSQVGPQTFIIVVTDISGAVAEQPVNTIVRSNSRPAIISDPVANVNEGEEFITQVIADDVDGDPIHYQLVHAPSSAIIDSVTGNVTWSERTYVQSVNTLNTQCLRNSFEHDGDLALADLRVGDFVYDEANLVVTFTISNLGLATMDRYATMRFYFGGFQLYTQNVAPLDSGESITRSIRMDPPSDPSTAFATVRVSLDNNGMEECSEDNNTARMHMFIVQADDPYGLTTNQVWYFNVLDVNSEPQILASELSPVYATTQFDHVVEIVDPDAGDGHLYELVDAPQGMEIEPAHGVLRWSPTNADVGTHSFVVRVTDLRGAVSEQSFSLDVLQRENTAPVSSHIVVNVKEDEGSEFVLLASDVDNDELVYTLLTSPVNGVVSGVAPNLIYTPNSNVFGTDLLTFVANDGEANSNISTVSFVVEAVNDAPVAQSLSAVAVENTSIELTLAATDIENSELNFSITNQPTNGVLSGTAPNVTYTPNTDYEGEDSFSFIAHDGELNSNEALVSITLTPANEAPIIISSPVTQTAVDALYSYQINAIDPEGTDLTYQLVSSPIGMVMNATGLIQWTPTLDQVGTYIVGIRVSDTMGSAVEQTYSLNVEAANSAPVFESAPVLSATASQSYQYLAIAQDADGDTLTYDLSASPQGMTIDANTGLINWLPSSSQVGEFDVVIIVSDGELTAEQAFSIIVGSVSLPLTLEVSINPAVVDQGEEIFLQAIVENVVGTLNLTATLNGDVLPLNEDGSSVFTPTVLGENIVVVNAADDRWSLTETVIITVRDPADTTPPFVELLSPVDDSTLTTPSDIVATVFDTNLEQYRVLYRRKNQEHWTEVSTGTTNVDAQALGVFDTTSLINGIYQIAIQAIDKNGQSTVASTTVIVDGDLKVGNFSFTVRDIMVPLAGIPIEVNRTYDSRRRNELLDFGFGWSIDYQNVRVEESRTLGSGWALKEYPAGPFGVLTDYCVEPLGEPIVTVTLPNGDIERFDVSASPQCNIGAPILDVQFEFSPHGDTQSTLTSSDGSGGRLVGENIVFLGDDDPIDPSLYQLTTKSGYVYNLDQRFGVKTIEDPNGHTLTYTDEGIFHSSGKSVLFVRDSSDKIIEVIDPAGEGVTYEYDSNNDLVSVTERDDAKSRYTYVNDHALDEMFDPLDRKLLKNIYDDNGRLIAQEDTDGVRTVFDHDIEGRFSLVTDRNNDSTQFFYDDKGNVLTQVNALNETTTYTYDVNDNQLSVTNDLDQTTSATFNERNDQLTQKNALDHIISYKYNSRGQETKITDANLQEFNMVYDSVGNLVSIEDPEKNSAVNVINEQGLVSTTTDVMQNTTHYTYDDEGNKLSETDSEDNLTSYTYDDNNNVLSETRRRIVDGETLVEVTYYEYDSRNRVIATINALNQRSEIEYDLAGNESARIDAFDRRTEMDYDVYGRLIETRYPDGTSTSHTYDAEGNKLTDTDRMGRTTTYVYDELNRQIEMVYVDDSSVKTEYDRAGRVSAEIDANQNRTEYEYDAAGRRILTRDAQMNEHHFEYDKNGNLIAEVDANDHRTEYVYNALDQKIQTIYHNGSDSQDVYDALSRRTQIIDQADIDTDFVYDSLGRLLSVTDMQDNITSYSYDEVGNKLTQTDAKARTTTWEYDALGRVIKRILPLGQEETFTYDAVGNMETRTDFNGETTTYTYDPYNDRLMHIAYGDGQEERFDYDDNGNRTEVVQTSILGEERTTVYEYDDRDRLVKEEQANGHVLEYSYDDNGNRTSVSTTTLDGESTSTAYTFDSLNRLESVTDNQNQITTYGYDAVGNRSSVSYPNGSSEVYTYDELNRLIKKDTYNGSGALVQSFDYTLHPTGRRTQIDELDGRKTEYVYDNLYRLSEESISDNANSNYNAVYEYDEVGNRIYETVDGVSTAYTYDDNDRLTQSGGTTYDHDENGNTLSETLDGETTYYSYDGRNKLVDVTKPDLSYTAYSYNADGIRIGQDNGATEIFYLVDTNRDYAQVLLEWQNDEVLVHYTYGDDLINQERNEQAYFYHYDGLGSTRALSNELGELTDTYNYEAFGEVLNQTGSTENSYLFTGEQFDANLDQYYLRARYYDQGVGRFTQMDTWMGRNVEPITLNKYLYAHADPISYTDPSGYLGLASLGAANNIQGQLQTISVGRVATIGFAANDAAIVGTTAASSKQIGLFVLVGMGASGAKLFDMLSSKDDNGEPDEVVPYYRAVDTGEMVDILDCNCFRFPDAGFGIEPTAVKRFWLDPGSAITFGNRFILGDFAGAREDSFFVVNGNVSKSFDAVVRGISGGDNPGDRFIGEGRAVGYRLLPALNAEMQRHGGVHTMGEY